MVPSSAAPHTSPAADPSSPGAKPLAVTMGDPAGIGPDIALLAWRDRAMQPCPPYFVIGAAQVFQSRAAILGLADKDFQLAEIERPDDALRIFPQAFPVLPQPLPRGTVLAGSPDVANSSAVISSIEEAVTLTAAGEAAAVVTNPIAKHVLLRHGFAHPGHTEFLGELAARLGYADAHPVMLMASSRLMAVPVTIHVALKEVPQLVTRARIVNVALITSQWLARYFSLPNARLAVCGLNPHAGENGELGREEIDTIAPAIAELKSLGVNASGPYSADTLFHDAARKGYDAVLTMYHDQALIPFKTLSFEDGVNVTLGLPFIRTSPDHGTAFSLAGTGHVNVISFREALRTAERMYLAGNSPPAFSS